jgi:hypothetical protein
MDTEEIVNLYNSGLSCSDISKLDGRCETIIYNILKDNVKIRSRSEANKIFPDFLLVGLYNLGLSTSQIGELLGIHQSTVSKRFKKLNFPLRNKSVANKIAYSKQEFNQIFMDDDFKQNLREMIDEHS